MESESSTRSDRDAIVDYFASREFVGAAGGEDPFANRLANEPLDGTLYRTWSLELESDDHLSIGIAFWGLGAACMLVGILVPYGVSMVGGVAGNSFFLWIALVQSFFGLLIACLTLSVVTASLWHVSLWKRFATVVAIVLPGMMLMMGGLSQIWFLEDGFIWSRAVILVTAICTIAGLTALPFQFWGGWSLSHARQSPTPLPPLGVRTIMEMTLLSCPIFWMATRVQDPNVWKDVMLLAIAVIALTVGVVGLLMAQLDDRPRRTMRLRRWITSGVAALLATITFSITGMIAFAKYESTIASQASIGEGVTVAISIGIGTLVSLFVFWAGAWWLRACGWQCVRDRGSIHRDQ